MKRMLERKVRSRAQQLYESRGQAEGRALEDWFQAEAEILENPSIARLYRRLTAKDVNDEDDPLASLPEEARA